MKRFVFFLFAATHILFAKADYAPTDYTWTEQSRNSSESMPCGGHDIGMNVWVENNDILFYVSRSGFFDENNTLLKAGRFRLHFEDNPFKEHFSQTLCLKDGCLYIQGDDIKIRIWADVYSPVVFLEVNGNGRESDFYYESWRYRDRLITKAELQQSSWKWLMPKDCKTFADTIRANNNTLTFYHQNRSQTIFDFTVDYEHLNAIKDKLYNPIGNLKWGGTLHIPNFVFSGTTDGDYNGTDFKAWRFHSNKTIHSVISLSLDINNPVTINSKTSKKRSSKWWNDYWQKSWIQTDNEDAQEMIRNYELFRYLLGCNAYGEWPTKFNGSLFTFDPSFVDSTQQGTPDYRRWGGGTMTAQNQRLVYWPMLKSGDIDMMKSQFDTYLRMLPNAVGRTKYNWNIEGASFTEQIENFGLPNPAEFGKHKEGMDYGLEKNKWLEYLWDTSLEFCQMILLAQKYDGMDITPYEDLIHQCIIFFNNYYKTDSIGKLIIYPGSGAETFKLAHNPSSTIAALKTVLETWGKHQEILDRIPEIPLRTIDGDTCIAPAISWARVQNVETPQLYPVFPWRIYGLGRPHLNIAHNTYFKDQHALEMRSSKGWKQDNIWAACLGLEEEAVKLNKEKMKNGPFRFPAFFDKGFDWAPDINRGGAGMIGIQEMLLQETADGELLLFPCWPKQWNCKFRLHATGQRIVEAEIKNGKIVSKTKIKGR